MEKKIIRYNYGSYGFMDFARLWALMQKKGLKKQFLVENGFSPTTINKLVKNENVNCEILTRLCYLLNTDIKNIMEYKKPEKTTEKS